MSLNLNKLEKARHLANGSVLARCPACAESGQDRKREHLLIKPDGRFGCCVFPQDREHRKRIFALAGDREPKSIQVKTPVAKVAAAPSNPGILGRLGRLFPTPTQPNNPDASDGVNEVCPKMVEVRTPRTGVMKSNQGGEQQSRTLRTPQYSYTYRKKSTGEANNIYVQGVLVGASEASELSPPPVELSEGVRSVRSDEEGEVVQPAEGVGVRLPFFTADGTLSIPFDSPERYHWWNGGQSIAETRSEITERMSYAGEF